MNKSYFWASRVIAIAAVLLLLQPSFTINSPRAYADTSQFHTLGKVKASKSKLKYPNTLIGGALTKELTITNSSQRTTNYKSSIDNSSFSILGADGQFTLLPNEMKTLLVEFSPVARGEVRGAMIISADDPSQSPVTVTLKGKGKRGDNLVLNRSSAQPGERIIISGINFDPSKHLSAVFYDHDGYQVRIPSNAVTQTSVDVTVPYYMNIGQPQIHQGTLSVAIGQENVDDITGLGVADNFQVLALPSTGLPAGSVSAQFLKQADILHQVLNDRLLTIETVSTGQIETSQLRGMLNDIQENLHQINAAFETLRDGAGSQVSLGMAAGQEIVIDSNKLTTIDDLLLVASRGTVASGTSPTETAPLELIQDTFNGVIGGDSPNKAIDKSKHLIAACNVIQTITNATSQAAHSGLSIQVTGVEVFIFAVAVLLVAGLATLIAMHGLDQGIITIPDFDLGAISAGVIQAIIERARSLLSRLTGGLAQYLRPILDILSSVLQQLNGLDARSFVARLRSLIPGIANLFPKYIVGFYTGNVTVNLSSCFDPRGNRTFGGSASGQILNQVDGHFVSSLFDTSNGSRATFEGTIDRQGQITGQYHSSVPGRNIGSGGTFTGNLTGNTLILNYIGPYGGSGDPSSPCVMQGALVITRQ